MRTAQDIFDQVATHLLKQKRRSYDQVAQCCTYHNEDGTRCAVGCLISDGAYKHGMEGMLVGDALLNELPIELKEELEPHKRLLQFLQEVHDDHEPAEWADQLIVVALSHNLTATPPEAA